MPVRRLKKINKDILVLRRLLLRRRTLKILASHDIERFKAIIFAALTLPGFIVLSIFIIFGHILAYQGWSILLVAWNPSKISSLIGIIYLFLWICSVMAHELGHLAVAVYIGEPSVEICVQFNSWIPTFMTKHNIKHVISISRKPVLDLAGIYAQLLFASSLGILFFFTQNPALPASILLIDIGILVALVPSTGTDGYWFFIDTQRVKTIQKSLGESFKDNIQPPLYPRGYTRLSVAFKISLFFLFFLYIIAALLLFLGVIYQWVDGWYIKSGLEDTSFYEIFGYLTLPIPAIVYAILAFQFLKMAIFKQPPEKVKQDKIFKDVE